MTTGLYISTIDINLYGGGCYEYIVEVYFLKNWRSDRCSFASDCRPCCICPVRGGSPYEFKGGNLDNTLRFS